MAQGLYESIFGYFSDGTPLFSVSQKDREILSIADNLKYLFTSRQGHLSHLPEYGLPDISEVFRSQQEGIWQFQSAIKNAAVKFEPRLRAVKVIPLDCNTYNKFLFLVSGTLVSGFNAKFEVSFCAEGILSVRPHIKKPGNS